MKRRPPVEVLLRACPRVRPGDGCHDLGRESSGAGGVEGVPTDAIRPERRLGELPQDAVDGIDRRLVVEGNVEHVGAE